MNRVCTANPESLLGELSYAEVNFLKVLNKVLAEEMAILVKVRVQDVINEIGSSIRNLAQDFGDQTFDFVLRSKEDYSVLCAIELDDRSHPERKINNEELNKNLKGIAELPVIKIPALCGYDADRLKHKVLQTI
jgi:hypothetical protein